MKFFQIGLILIAIKLVSTKCPSACQCYEQSKIFSIFCVQNALKSIPNSFNFDVKILNFTGNNLPVVANAFRNPYYKSLEILDLRNNGIQYITDKAFRRLKNLLEIDLSDNNIRKLNEKIFKKCLFLNTIRIRNNPLEEVKSYAFPALIYLKTLDFQGCKLKEIYGTAFINTPLLENLNLKDNNLKTLPLNVIHLIHLKVLLLDGNPWRCNKNLWRVLKWIQDKNSTADTSILCVYGETDNAIFWDTMDVDNPGKFENIRNKRAISSNENAQIKTFMKKRTAVLRARHIREEKTGKISFEKDEINGNCTQLNEYVAGQNFKPPVNITVTEKNIKKETSTARTPSQSLQYNHVQVQRNYADQPKSFEDSRVARKYSYFRDQEAMKKVHLHTTTVNYENEDDRDSEVYESQNREYQDEKKTYSLNSIKVTESTNNVEGFENSETGDEFDIKVMVLLIILEFALLIVLLFILYKLWKWNRSNAESGVNIPLNNGSKKMKSYDSQTSGYKRYSLSDEDYTDIRNRDDAKYDAESGYLSYHRYNSIEGDNNNDYIHYKKFYGNENQDLENHEPRESSNELHLDSATHDNSSSRRSRNDSVKSNRSRSNVDGRNHLNDHDN